ncbi:hypothetical protein BT63DRAFT_402628 [Microthyrium microscopicum]|uniref:Spindle pole body component n=1 Tax=Microthyrium microscopicum TaxID=703497 RepID=A0A6A6UAR6_9PEZI|nr:hypothetical protein BT63DRAFT_402628 [Microthyrium microscopicum]
MEIEDSLDAFAIPDLWRPSRLFASESQGQTLFPEVELDVTVIRLNNPYAPKTNLVSDLQLPDLDTFKYGPLEDLPPLDESVLSAEPEDNIIQEPEEDVWALAAEPLRFTERRYFSWEAFSGGPNVTKSPYLSEWGPSAFDIALRAYYGRTQTPIPMGPVVKANPAIKALYELALGRSSLLFDWDNRTKTFKPTLDGFSMTGLTTVAFQSIYQRMNEYGASMKQLQRFIEKTYASGDIPSRVSLANSISAILSGIEAHLSKMWLQVKSVLQLQHLLEKPGRLLQDIVKVVQALRAATTDEQLCSILFSYCQDSEHGVQWLSAIMLQILLRTSRPLLERIGQWVGLSAGMYGQPPKDALDFIQLDPDHDEDTPLPYLILNESKLPRFISKETGDTLLEMGQSLKLLQTYHPDHVLAKQCSTSLQLEWELDWHQADAVLEKARKYESDLATAVRQYKSGNPATVPMDILARDPPELIQDKDAADYEAVFLSSLRRLDHTPSDAFDLPDELMQIVLAQIDTQQEAIDCGVIADNMNLRPAVSLLPALSFEPILNSQARLVRGASLRLLFRSHNLRDHLNVQKSFHLLGDGVFISRLSAALFDSTVSTTERQLGVMRSGSRMGLKLRDRSTWPPASSELRLALMGILNDCYAASKPPRHELASSKTDLPGSLSFAIRNLSADEITTILDPHSLHALDFLRLSYTPPAPIALVITPRTLDAYDAVFKFLLRITRLLFSVSRLPMRGSPAVLRASMEMRHVVNSCAAYFFDTAVGEGWASFVHYLDGVEAAIAAEDAENPAGMRDVGGIEELRRRHEGTLDGILFGLLLRQRQRKIMGLLEEVFGCVLALEKLCQMEKIDDLEVIKLQKEFEEKTRLFVEVCRGVSGKKGYAAKGQEENTIDRLVSAIDYNGWFSSK